MTGPAEHLRRRRSALAMLRECWRQWLVERRLRRRGRSFRGTDPERLSATYGGMSADEFEVINAPQQWLNERVIPLALAELDAATPLCIADLGCGSGASMQLLAAQAPPGSTLIGYDLCRRLLERARRRDYRAADGGPLSVEFVCQSITAPLRDGRGEPLAAGSVDVAHAAGVVGHHLDEAAAGRLAAELARVLAPGGLAILDAGPRLPAARLGRVLAAAGLLATRRHRVLPFGTRYPVTFRRRDAAAGRRSWRGGSS